MGNFFRNALDPGRFFSNKPSKPADRFDPAGLVLHRTGGPSFAPKEVKPTPAKPYQMSQAMKDRLGPEGLARLEANRQAAAALRQKMGYGGAQQAPQQTPGGIAGAMMRARGVAPGGGGVFPGAAATGSIGQRVQAMPNQAPQAAVADPRRLAGRMMGGMGGGRGGIAAMGYADGGKVFNRKGNGKPK